MIYLNFEPKINIEYFEINIIFIFNATISLTGKPLETDPQGMPPWLNKKSDGRVHNKMLKAAFKCVTWVCRAGIEKVVGKLTTD
ncbi:hypothetical protein EGT74_10045 [Chitinophaga lutea]|uniref:Uncharacterized protein n=1 Tax=Chitinophaga lutea TaxID=2488634 RepID=A0A3N4Q8E6_9BACT|nr:hypothetical protein EGT74_10045 [Chitinophaga lutea]